MDSLAHLVSDVNACALPGCNIKYEAFCHVCSAAIRAGYVDSDTGAYVMNGLRYGFDLGCPEGVPGQSVFKNYPSAVEGRVSVTRATMARVCSGKTLCLGLVSAALFVYLRRRYSRFAIFPMGAVPKPLEPSEMRPTSDHSRTRFNSFTCMDRFRHALTAYKDVAYLLKKGFVMYVTDVEAAFPMLPLAPCIWMFFMFKFFADDVTENESLFMHIFGDFGAAGLPGTFKLFFVDCVIPMARFALRLTLPMVVYVDDVGMIGRTEHETDAEMRRFQEWCERVTGIIFKVLKDKPAATLQLYVGFWWDSISMTRTLDERKLVAYLGLLDDYAHARSLTLRERRSVGGKMVRAIMTLPPGASCLLSSIFLLMHGLTLGWQSRRTTKEERSDFLLLAVLLRLNMGRGYYSFDEFIKGVVTAASDASKERRFAGGGYWTRGIRNTYRFFRFGGRAARHTIMVLEGFTSLLCGSDNGYLWRNHFVEFWIDNQSYAGAGNKGRSRSYTANVICKRWFVVMVRHMFMVQFRWLSTDDNREADDLSRDREADFLLHMAELALWGLGERRCIHLPAPRLWRNGHL